MAQSVPITLGERAFSLRFDLNALADLEDAVGQSINRILDQEKAGITTIRALLWAGLKWRDPSLTIRQAGVLLQDHADAGGDVFGEAAETLMRALVLSGVLGKAAKDAALALEATAEGAEGNAPAEVAETATPASATG